MRLLNDSGLRETLDRRVQHDKVPVLGICVGMQMLAHSSEEGKLKGLGWIDATIEQLRTPLTEGRAAHPLPHMGWNSLLPARQSLLFNNLDAPRFYFLHSYHMVCRQPENVLAVTEYGMSMTSVVRSQNIYGIQCHPEKSHHDGVQLLANFAAL
jgi:glutamine amidotransferase